MEGAFEITSGDAVPDFNVDRDSSLSARLLMAPPGDPAKTTAG